MRIETQIIKIVVYQKRRYLKIGDAAKMLGVSPWTLRRWDKENWLKPFRTMRNTRLYDFDLIRKLIKQ